MKRTLILMMSVVLAFTVAGCSNNRAIGGADGPTDIIISNNNAEITTYSISDVITEINGTEMLIDGPKGCFSVPMQKLEASPEPQVGDILEVTYDGRIEELYPEYVRLELSDGMLPEIVKGSVNIQTGKNIPPYYAVKVIKQMATEEERKLIDEDIQNIYEIAEKIFNLIMEELNITDFSVTVPVILEKEKLNVEKQIHFLGFRKDIPKLLKISNLSISSANQEGLPVNIMEAMYAGLPIVASNCRGNRDLVKDNINGYLVDIEDNNRFKELLAKEVEMDDSYRPYDAHNHNIIVDTEGQYYTTYNGMMVDEYSVNVKIKEYLSQGIQDLKARGCARYLIWQELVF
mgnify:CR=1 FL=1